MKNILIVGAGLCGSLLALRMAQKGFKVTVVEKRPDLRTTVLDAGRSINLALSNRGMRALKTAGIEDEVNKLLIPMTGRMIHEKSSGKTFLSPYSGRNDEYINSVSRPGLNKVLLNAAEEEGVKIYFNHPCKSIDFENTTIVCDNTETQKEVTFQADVIFGTDGAGSVIRSAMINNPDFLFSISHQWLSHGYKELEILPDKNNGYKIYKNALHIWPRGENMLIALPNLNGSFTVTLFLPHKKSYYSFENLTTSEKVTEFFQNEFPDVLQLIPNLTEQFFTNPIGLMGTVKCAPLHYEGKVLLMGDAAHAMVPFYGQGMNASFEDVGVLDRIIENYKTTSSEWNWNTIFETFEKARIADAQAIGELSLDNFDEMKAHTGMELFQKKRKLELAFESEFPDIYYSKYSLVTFREDLPYAEAKRLGRAQDNAILSLLHEHKLDDTLSLEEKLEIVKERTELILEQENKPGYLHYTNSDF
ncbi:MAG: FAD-dependent monooxygenase [Bacteroidetes bacterium]|nr:FAD-dependent monooxygenase [Bacteroidota bacterium]